MNIALAIRVSGRPETGATESARPWEETHTMCEHIHTSLGRLLKRNVSPRYAGRVDVGPFPLTGGIAVIPVLKHWGVVYSSRQWFGSALTFGNAATW